MDKNSIPFQSETEDMINTVQNKKLRNLLLSVPALIVAIAFLAFLLQYIFYQKAKNDNINIRADITANQNALADINTTNKNFAIAKLKEIYSASELTEVTEKYREYHLTLAGNEVKSTTLYVPAGSVNLELTEISTASAFPYEIEVYGSLTDKNSSVKLWSFVNIERVSPKAKTSGNTTTVRYELSGKRGSSIKVNLSPVLVDRLGLKESYIIVKFS